MTVQDQTPAGTRDIQVNRATRTIRLSGRDAVKLRPQSFAVFELLAEAYPDTASKDHLVTEAWKGRAVSDDNLVQSIREIRRSLGDVERAIVQTMPSRGYRLTVPLRGAARGQGDTVAAVADPIVRPAIGVLDFTDLSSDDQHKSLALGLSNDLVMRLTQSGTLSVLSPMLVVGSNHTTALEKYRNMGARYVLGGAVQGSGKALRISAQLTDLGSGTVVWVQDWTGETAAYFDLQRQVLSDIIGAVANNWSGILVDLEVAKSFSQPTENLAAYQRYQLGIHAVLKLTAESIAEAEGHLSAAVELDPQYGEAWAGLAVCYALMSSALGGEEAMQARVGRYECGHLARQYAPLNSWCALVGAWNSAADGDVEGAKNGIDRAVESSANNTDIMAAAAMFSALNTDLYEEAEALARAAIATHADPPSWYHAFHGVSLFFQEKDEAALASLLQGPPTYSELLAYRAATLARLGRKADAAADVATLQAYYPHFRTGDYIATEAFCDPQKVAMVRAAFSEAGIPA